MNDSDEESNSGNNNGNWSIFKGNIQGDSDDEENIDKLNAEKQKKEDDKGRHKTFALELVFVNRIIKE